MALSPNSGKDYYILDPVNQHIHYLKNEKEECEILKYCNQNSGLNHSYENAKQLCLAQHGFYPSDCPHCFKD